MSKVVAGMCTIIGGLFTYYFLFVMVNSSWHYSYNDPKFHKSMFETGHMVPLVFGILMLTVGLTFFFVSKEPNPHIKKP